MPVGAITDDGLYPAITALERSPGVMNKVTPQPDAVPRADSSGTLNDWITMQYNSIKATDTVPRVFDLVKRADGAPITSGTVNYYIYALTGTNATKYWKEADGTWAATAQDNAMTHVADGHWKIQLGTAAYPWVAGDSYLEYAKESGDLHIPVSRGLKAF